MKYIVITFLLFSLTAGANEKLSEKNNESQNIFKIEEKLESISKSNKFLLNKIEEQKISIQNLSQKLDTSSFSKDYIYPVFLSIIAAMIFWIAFSYLPEKARKKKVRDKLDLNMHQVYLDMFTLFDIVMKANMHSPSDYQEQIRGNNLSKSDIELGLQNKCINEKYLYYEEICNELLPVGRELFTRIKRIDENIERIFNFSTYLSPEEILLLEEIRTKLHTYDFSNSGDTSAFTKIGNSVLYPVNPSISYMTNNFAELYKLFILLQEIVFSNEFSNRDLTLNKMQHYYYSGAYKDCIKLIKKERKNYPNDRIFFSFYHFLSSYELGNIKSTNKILINILEEKPDLISSRGFLSSVINDDNIKGILNKYYLRDELKRLHIVMNKEEKHSIDFTKRAVKLRDFYILKASEVTPIHRN